MRFDNPKTVVRCLRMLEFRDVRRPAWVAVVNHAQVRRVRARFRARDKKPLIGVSGPDRGGLVAWAFTWLALRRAGATARRITPARGADPAHYAGFVIGGGADVTEPLPDQVIEPPPRPSRIRWPRRALDVALAPAVLSLRLLSAKRGHGADRARDRLETALLAYARAHDLPVLGICRGAQLMNVTEGGTLLRDVGALYDERPALYTVLPRREVQIAPDSRLRGVLGRDNLLVNSLHYHAVRDPGRALRIVAVEPSGVPQAIEHQSRRFWLGVQWHPEYLPQQESHQRLFRALTRACLEGA